MKIEIAVFNLAPTYYLQLSTYLLPTTWVIKSSWSGNLSIANLATLLVAIFPLIVGSQGIQAIS